MSLSKEHYHVPDHSPWPFITAVALFILALGAITFIQQFSDSGLVKTEGRYGKYLFLLGVISIVSMMFFWFRDTIKESRNRMNSHQLDVSYRLGMQWFIFSEIMFFSVFFFALFYTRLFVVPWLGGDGEKFMTHELLWPNFQNLWPTPTTPDGRTVPVMPAWGLPLINTIILASSSFTVSRAHRALLEEKRSKLTIYLITTLLLGYTFLALQAKEYVHAYSSLHLTLESGIYGTIFYALTGFHGLHVTIGVLMLTIMLIRIFIGHFTPQNHFAFEAATWYWHFVDAVWVVLFVTVYWL